MLTNELSFALPTAFRPQAMVAPGELRGVLSRFATGVVILSVGGSRIHGMTANAFTSVSLDPPLVLCCVARTARMCDSIRRAGTFGVSIMGADQEHLARYFADRGRPRGQAQFDSVEWHASDRTGVPLLAGSLGWLECRTVDIHESGDHTIFIGGVLTAGQGDAGDGLLFFDGGYQRVPSAHPAPASAPSPEVDVDPRSPNACLG